MDNKNMYDNSDELNRNNEENINNFSQENDSYASTDKDDPQVAEDTLQGEKAKDKADESQEQAASFEEATDEGEGADAKAESYDNLSSSEYVWTPPASNVGEGAYHYSGEALKRHTSSGSYREDNISAEQEKKKKKNKALKITLVVVACLLGIAIIGTSAFYLTKRIINGIVSSSGGSDQNAIIFKNDGPVKVQTQVNSDGSPALSKADVVANVSDSVVDVLTADSSGSGVIISQTDNYAFIVTNEHVVSRATSIKITLRDKNEYSATYIDGDYYMDIAVLRIRKNSGEKLTQATFGSSSALRIGDDVLAIGNAFGILGGTVTSGIVSGLNRETNINKFPLIQIDAAVNPGNSGGGLFNMAGELVGIVCGKTVTEASDNTGYVIPVDLVYEHIVETIEDGYIHGRATINIEVEYMNDPFDAFVKYQNSNTGIYVARSSNSKINEKDRLVSLNGYDVKDAVSYTTAVSSLEVGEKVVVELERRGVSKVVRVEVDVVEYIPSGVFS